MIDGNRNDIFPAAYSDSAGEYKTAAMESFTYHAGPRADEVEVECAVSAHPAIRTWLVNHNARSDYYVSKIAPSVFAPAIGLLVRFMRPEPRQRFIEALPGLLG